MATGGVQLSVRVPDDEGAAGSVSGSAMATGPNSCSKRKLDEVSAPQQSAPVLSRSPSRWLARRLAHRRAFFRRAQLFYYWLSLEETKDMITSLVDDVKSGRGLPQVESHTSSMPLSPVSKLLKSSKDVVAPWSPGRGQPNTPPRSPGSPRMIRRAGADPTLPPVSPKAGSKTKLQITAPQAQVIPQFFFPQRHAPMVPAEQAKFGAAVDALFATSATGELDIEELRPITVEVAGLPCFMNSKLFERLAPVSAAGAISATEPTLFFFFFAPVNPR